MFSAQSLTLILCEIVILSGQDSPSDLLEVESFGNLKRVPLIRSEASINKIRKIFSKGEGITALMNFFIALYFEKLC